MEQEGTYSSSEDTAAQALCRLKDSRDVFNCKRAMDFEETPPKKRKSNLKTLHLPENLTEQGKERFIKGHKPGSIENRVRPPAFAKRLLPEGQEGHLQIIRVASVEDALIGEDLVCLWALIHHQSETNPATMLHRVQSKLNFDFWAYANGMSFFLTRQL